MYPKSTSKGRIKISILDVIDDLFDFVISCVNSMKDLKTFSTFLDKNLHI